MDEAKITTPRPDRPHPWAEGEQTMTDFTRDQIENVAPKKHTYRTDIDYAPDGTAWSWTVAECECDRPWRHA